MPAENPIPQSVDGLVQNTAPDTPEEILAHAETLRNSGLNQRIVLVDIMTKFVSPDETMPREILVDMLDNLYHWGKNAAALTSVLIYAAQREGNNIVSVHDKNNKKHISYYMDSSIPSEKKTRRHKNVKVPGPRQEVTDDTHYLPESSPTQMEPDEAIRMNEWTQPPAIKAPTFPPKQGFPVFKAPEKKPPKKEKSYECPIPPSGEDREAFIQQAMNNLIPTNKTAATAILTRWENNPMSVSEWLNEINKNRSPDRHLTGFYLDTLISDIKKGCGMIIERTKKGEDIYVYRKA